MLRRFFFISFFLVFSANAAESSQTENLIRACKLYTERSFNTVSNSAQRSQCTGYFFGVTSLLLFQQQQKIVNSSCLPNNLSVDKAVRDFIRWIDTNQSAKEKQPTEAVLAAFTELYPCQPQ
jgi:hypothetical protein